MVQGWKRDGRRARDKKVLQKHLTRTTRISPQPSDQDHFKHWSYLVAYAVFLLESSLYPIKYWIWTQGSKPQVASWKLPPHDVCSPHFSLSLTSVYHRSWSGTRMSVLLPLDPSVNLRVNTRWYPPGVWVFFPCTSSSPPFSCFYHWELLVDLITCSIV